MTDNYPSKGEYSKNIRHVCVYHSESNALSKAD